MEQTEILKQVVTIGGGKGQSTVLQGLKNYNGRIHISAIVSMVDDGGSTGRLSEELGIPPFGGDFKDVMTGLSRDKTMINLFHHRYEYGTDIKGHTVGNLMLLGLLEQCQWDIPKAISLAKKILTIEADIYPSTVDRVKLVAEYKDGSVVKGQDEIDNNLEKKFQTITNLNTEPIANVYEPAAEAIRKADAIVLCPGDLYGSLLCNLVVPGIKNAIAESKAQIIYITNLMTKVNQTHDWQTSQFIHEVQRYLPRKIDYAVVNTGLLPRDIAGLEQYKEEHWEMVKNDIPGEDFEGTKVVGESIWYEGQEFRRVSTDVIPRSFIRHDPQKIAALVMDIIKA